MKAFFMNQQPRIGAWMAITLLSSIVCGEEPKYPLAVTSVVGGVSYVVDLDLPGVFKKSADQPLELFKLGSKRFREPLNRPRCAVVASDGGVLVGDTASRDVYLVSGETEPKPLTGGNVGIPMSLVIKGDEVFVADLETRFILQFPLSGGKPETFAEINTRGLFLDSQNRIWAVTQEEAQLVILDEAGKPTPVVSSRVFEFPHNVVVLEDGTAFVTDGYRKAIWQIKQGQAPEIFIEKGELKNPVGLALDGNNLLIADPHAKQIFRLNIETKELKPLLP